MTEEEFENIGHPLLNSYITQWVGLIDKDIDVRTLTTVEYLKLGLPAFYSHVHIGNILMRITKSKKLVYYMKYDFVLKSFFFGFTEDKLYQHEEIAMSICKAICCEFIEIRRE
jgi:hypothetical protein